MQFIARLSLAIAVAFSLCVQGALAADATWTVVKSAGAVRVAAPNASAQPVSLTNALTPGSIITTGGDGQLLLRRGEQEILVGPNSRMSLPVENAQGVTRVMQDLGTLLFKVDKRQVKHFQVETPIIAAVVKGTTFTVTADVLGDSVHVAEGLVEVRTMQGGAVANVPAGETVFVARNAPEAIQFKGAESSTSKPGASEVIQKVDNERGNASDSSKTATLVIPKAIGTGPLDFNALTDGLAAKNASVVSIDEPGRDGGGGATAATAASVVTIDVAAGLRGNALGVGHGNGVGNGKGLVGFDAGLDAGTALDGGGAIDLGVDAGIGGGGLGVDLTAGGGSGVDVGLDAGVGGGGGELVGVDVTAGNGNGVGVGANVGGGLGAGVNVGGEGGLLNVDVGGNGLLGLKKKN